MHYLCVHCFNVLFNLKFCRIYGGEWNVCSVVIVWLEYEGFMFRGGIGCCMRWFSGCVVSSDFCLSWDAWSLRCVSNGST